MATKIWKLTKIFISLLKNLAPQMVKSRLGEWDFEPYKYMCLSCYGSNHHGDMLSNVYTLASLQRNVTLLCKEVTCYWLYFSENKIAP